ncbi:UDP-N-acetylmuramoyl-L-alanyl-D-glutamate--2,6-diaminopimelate ligase [Rhodoferax koreense]|uniref:UDP-N-acetylmuramoyl-L-alanyl-D-glutamate--2,6-diaminopimelate ligase n=1 Tax=Rhodoferax koreensis TaxID=1842727 RepID=A0A1P8K1K9_9BURK|nr:UDP-N-acetylmuramoyl-L-alanyl-D-glutamate--2,6-diaminopimelate ligase [Rhodoferax koreense]APW39902.1 UDP-N-acetylmuramoyl-L-alanyl-D-glutamate--2,6-diaminopimelate ligase [Rhodoferax koreense]
MNVFQQPLEAAHWLRGLVASGSGSLQVDSRRVRPGDAFIAWPGAAVDGRQFIGAALAQGAVACLIEASGHEAFGFHDERVAGYAGLKASTGPIAAAYFGHPSDSLDVLAVTGTNGKTSTSWWLAQALSKVKLPAPVPCAVVGTLGVGIPPEVEATGLTTPDPVLLQRQFRRFVDEGIRACAIEASSIGVAERRLDGTRIRVGIFTNFTQDHLDYHGGMDAYWTAKAELFAWPGLQAAVLNVDDSKGAELAATLAGGALDVWSVGIEAEARLRAVEVGYAAQGLSFTVVEGAERHRVQTPLIGLYNVSNLLGVMGAMRAMGVPLAEVVRACAAVTPVPGRMDCLNAAGQPLVAIDYAHTPDALDKALLALRPLASARGGQLWCVFGCGGDRDATKRPLMAAVAEKQADMVVVTSDNPRGEKPEHIIAQILLGLSHDHCVQVQADRALAIADALAQAQPQDVVLLAGKGHEATQEVAGVKHPFSDKAEAEMALQRRSGVAP